MERPRFVNNLAAALVLGSAGGKNKKSKTKCQQRRKPANLRNQIAHPGRGYTIRQCSRKKFIVTSKDGAELHDFKHNVLAAIEPDSKYPGRKYART